MKRIDELFNIKYGNSFDLASLTQTLKSEKHSINFVSRTAQNNGVSAVVEKIAGADVQQAGTLSVSVGGSVMEAFLQPEPYYAGYHVLILSSVQQMTDAEKLYYCACIRANKYKYNYGRQANKTLKSIMVPDITEIPNLVINAVIPSFEKIKNSVSHNDITLNTSTWKPFSYDKLFTIVRGSSAYLQDMRQGPFPYVSATSSNNGISAYVDISNRPANLIVLNYDGSIGDAFYQPEPFFASEKVVTISLKNHNLNKYIAMFLITLLQKEKFRYNYGLKWSVNSRMKHSIINLPTKDDGTPDWIYMENFIKSLPFSASM